jgi:hypothetical protein
MHVDQPWHDLRLAAPMLWMSFGVGRDAFARSDRSNVLISIREPLIKIDATPGCALRIDRMMQIDQRACCSPSASGTVALAHFGEIL